MDKRTENRYRRIKKEQARLQDEIKKKSEELESLLLEEEEIAGQEILAICKEQKISLIQAIDIFTKNEREEKHEAKVFEQRKKENTNDGIYK